MNSTHYPNATAVINREYGASTSLLDRVKGIMWIRRPSHYIFLFLSALALWVAVQRSTPEQDIVAKLGALFSIDLPFVLWKALVSDRLFDGILIGIVVFFLVGLWAEKKMRRRFSAFWHRVAPRLSV